MAASVNAACGQPWAQRRRPEPDARIAFLDQAHYSMVKINTFNGAPLPAIAIWNSETDALKAVRRFD